jgi:CRISPR-associated endonuclease/helicase Cas3
MSAHFERLLAKSRREGEEFSHSMLLIGHLQDVYVAAQRIVDATGADQLLAMGFDPALYLERFRRCVLLAAAVHDLGKANDHFLGMLTRTPNPLTNPPGLRHEWVTILLLRGLKPWLLPAVAGSETDFAIVEWAIAGHHPSPTHDSPPKSCPAGGGVELESLLGHPDATAILDWMGRVLPVTATGRPVVANARWPLAGGRSAFDEIGMRWREARILWDTKVRRSDDRRFVAAVKDCLVAADIAGSALAKTRMSGPRGWAWISRSFAAVPDVGELARVGEVRLNGKPARAFQRQVEESDRPVTFVKAGCGSGKTVTAYLWAAKNYPTRRLYFCYPTTGTATEGFKDYLFEPDGELGDLGAKLFHSRRDIDVEIVLGVDEETGEAAEREEAAKLESLEAWSTPVVACTVDTVLGIIQNNKRGLFAWPALAQSAFVFDEIHSYDDRLFGVLLRFLIDLPGLPVLLMTASLPRPREEALRRTLASRHLDLNPIGGPSDLEDRPRYHRVTPMDNDPLQLVLAELRAGGKVLWVCNTVARVMATADRLAEEGASPLIYHSRFKYIDRVDRHKAAISAFTREHVGPALAICSQVAEMSLDLKGCTLLVTELAPVPALIQRLGRLNRQAEGGDPTRPFCVIEPVAATPGARSAPYAAADLEAARQWLAKLPDGPITQRDLADRWEQTADQVPEGVASAWLDGGPITTVTELRELSPGISVLMREDVDRMQPSRGRDVDVGRYVLPMPEPRNDLRWQTWSRFKGIPIAEQSFIDYDRKRGGQWRATGNLSPLIV